MISSVTCLLCLTAAGTPCPAQPGIAAHPSLAGTSDGCWAAGPPGSLAHYLEVVLGVPVRVEDDAGVSSCQVDAQPTCPCAQQEDKAIRVGLAEAVDGSLAQVPTHPPIDALVGVSAPRGKR